MSEVIHLVQTKDSVRFWISWPQGWPDLHFALKSFHFNAHFKRNLYEPNKVTTTVWFSFRDVNHTPPLDTELTNDRGYTTSKLRKHKWQNTFVLTTGQSSLSPHTQLLLAQSVPLSRQRIAYHMNPSLLFYTYLAKSTNLLSFYLWQTEKTLAKNSFFKQKVPFIYRPFWAFTSKLCVWCMHENQWKVQGHQAMTENKTVSGRRKMQKPKLPCSL